MSKQLIIVESPTKAKTLSRFLGNKYMIEASFGHIRDLPKSKMGVDETTLDVEYVIPKDKTKRVNELKRIAESASKIILATDPDREGEAIAWHILNILQEKKKTENAKKGTKKEKSTHTQSEYDRIVFHEITEHAIQEALKSPRKLNTALVDAQQARRVLDRLVGYKLSPLLWRKIRTGLSAGRVQSVAVRLIVEREREIQAFKSEEYWTIEVIFTANNATDRIHATLFKINNKKPAIKNEEQANKIHQKIKQTNFNVAAVQKKEIRKYPLPPFTTSTLQQTASNKLGFSAKKTMMFAQNLYEEGLITYMRTDSVNIAEEAIEQARKYIHKKYGKEYLPEKPKHYKTKSKVAQEAHEAIRPTDITKDPLNIKDQLDRDKYRLYTLIWNRYIACQMKDAVYDQTTIDIENTNAESERYTFRAVGRIIQFDGWLKIYGIEAENEEIKNENEQNNENSEYKLNTRLPIVEKGQPTELDQVIQQQHFTQPPARYTEASLVKALEERGIGRPSTYAPTIATILERKYIEKEQKSLKPTPIGIAVNDFLMSHFPDILDYAFTADLEQELDDIANGVLAWKPMIKAFIEPFSQKINETEKQAERVKIITESTGETCPLCASELIVRYGRFGKFIACSKYPECKHTAPFINKLEGHTCPKDGGQVIMKKTKRGRNFFGCANYPTCNWSSWTKPNSQKK